MRGYTEFVLADDVLSEVEEERWNEVAEALMPNAEPKEFGIETVTRLQVARINDGRLPVVPAGQSHVIEKRGESVHEEVAASLLKEVIDREFRGGSRGVSIPIVKGVRYRAGSFRGKSVVVGSHLEAADTGMLTVTSTRVVFTGNRKTLEVPFAKLISIDAYNDGVRLHASNRQNAPLFRMSEGSAPVVAATINMAVQRAS